MANQLADQKPPAARTYSEAEMRAAVAEANARSLAESNAALQQAAMARNMTPPAPPTRRGPDGFDAWTKEGLTRSPEEQARMLRHGTANVVDQRLNAAVDQIRQESAYELARAKDEMGLRSVLSAHPDIASDEEGYSAAIAKAAFRAQQRGLNLDGASMAQMAVAIYKEDHKPAPGTEVPFTEGAGRPDANGPGGAKKEGPNPVVGFLQEAYGVGGANDQVHGETRNFAEEDAIDDYLEGRLSPDTSTTIPVWGITQPLKDGLEGTGIGSGVRQAQGDFNKRKARRAAAGGK